MDIQNYPAVDLQERLSKVYCPLINGITHANGIVNRLAIESQAQQGEPMRKYWIEQSNQTSISELQSTNSLQWTSFNELNEEPNVQEDFTLLLGEGGWGSEGFVALLQLTTRKFLWIAFFDDSNPFTKARFENGKIIAVSTHGNEWTFSYPTPSLLSIV